MAFYIPLSLCVALAAASPSMAATASPLQITGRVMVERRMVASDGAVRLVLVKASKIVPGDQVVFSLIYRNMGSNPVSNIVLANPVPKGLAYRGAHSDLPQPDASVDGRIFAPVAALRVPLAGGGTRMATGDDIVAVRWRLDQPVEPGREGQVAFRAVVR